MIQDDPAGAAPHPPQSSSSAELAGLRIDKSGFEARKRGGKLRWVLAVVAVTAVVLAVLRFTGVLTPTSSVSAAMVAMYYPAQSFTSLSASGYVVAQRSAAVAAEITALLVELNVEEGDQVTTGQVLARLEHDDQVAGLNRTLAQLDVTRFALAEARSELRNAGLEYGRRLKLVEQGVISRSEFDSADARFETAQAAVSAREADIVAARAAVAEAEAALDDTYIYAPFDAVVLTKNADVGDIVTPVSGSADARASVVTIADLGSLQVEADVSESNIGQVTRGQPAEIRLDALSAERFPGRVHMIVPTADRSKASVLVKVAFDALDPRVLPEMSAKVDFLERSPAPDERAPVLAVPVSAVVERAGRQVVFAVRDGRAVEVPVETGRTFGGQIEILGGLDAGQRVVLNPPPELIDGGRIDVAEE